MTRRNAVATVVMVAVLVVGFAFAPAAAAAQEGPDDPPAAYYGTLILDGEPAPAGVEVTAYVNGEQRGSITTTEAGQYGGASALDRKLVVEGSSGEEGAAVEFYVNGQLANQTVEWYSGDVQEVNLAAGEGAGEPDDPDNGDGGNGGDGGDGGDGGAGGGGGGGGGAGTGGGGGGGAGTGGNGGGTAAPTIDATVESAGNWMNASATDVSAGATVNAEFPSPMNTGGVSVSDLSLTFDSDAGDVGVSASPVNESDLGDVPNVDFATPMSYLQIEKQGFENSALSSATVSFSVDTNALPDGLSANDVAMFRFDEGEWHELPTNYQGDGQYTAQTPGFSTFAVAGYQPDITVTAASLGASEVEPGQRVDVTATVENGGEADGRAVIALTVDGEIVSSRELQVDAGETRQVTFTPQFTDSGTYEVAVEEVTAGELTVESVQTAEDPGGSDQDGQQDEQNEQNNQQNVDQDPGDSPTQQFGFEVEYVVGLLAVVLVLAGAFVLRRR